MRHRMTLLIPLVLVLMGCGGGHLPHGMVVDTESGQPLADAYVLAEYKGDGPYVWSDPGATATEQCYGTLITKTDAEGRFDFSPLRANRPTTDRYTRNQYIVITAYKPGYTFEQAGKYHESVQGHSVYVKYEVATEKPLKLSMAGSESSAFKSRDEYLAYLIGFCGDFSLAHWQMTKTILEEEGTWASTIRQWGHATAVCKYLNDKNAEYKLEQDIVDCTVYDQKIEELEVKRFADLKAVVDGIDWGDGPKLELVFHEPIPGFLNQSNVAFILMNDKGKDVTIDNIKSLMKRVCTAGVSLERSFVCFTDRYDEGIWMERESTRCDAQYRPIFRNIRIQFGEHQGAEQRLPEGWCGQ